MTWMESLWPCENLRTHLVNGAPGMSITVCYGSKYYNITTQYVESKMKHNNLCISLNTTVDNRDLYSRHHLSTAPLRFQLETLVWLHSTRPGPQIGFEGQAQMEFKGAMWHCHICNICCFFQHDKATKRNISQNKTFEDSPKKMCSDETWLHTFYVFLYWNKPTVKKHQSMICFTRSSQLFRLSIHMFPSSKGRLHLELIANAIAPQAFAKVVRRIQGFDFRAPTKRSNHVFQT